MLALLLSLAAVTSQDPITVKLNHDQFQRGDRARVYVQTAQDGYLIVLHADPDGRVRILFPLDPDDDDFVRGGKRQELRGRSDRDAFLVDADDGSGMVLAAVASDPFDHTAFVRNDHWDYRALSAGTVKDDPLAVLLDVVRKMAGETRFEYDAASYVVTGRGGIAARYGFGHGYGWGYPARYRFGLSFGYPYRYGFGYDPFYDPFCYDPFWGSCYGFGFGYTYYRPYRFAFWPRTVVVGGFGNRGFVIPDRNQNRFVPVQPRPRSGFSDGLLVRDRQSISRPSRRVEPRVAPGERGGSRPRIAPAQPRSSGGRPSVSRGSSGGSRPAMRPGASGGRRGGGSAGGGGRRS